MLFSVIIPTYNRAEVLKETLQSVLDQQFEDYEVLIVDDGSTDHTGAMVKAIADPRIKYFYKANEERSIARNFGADRAEGRYVTFLDSDDKMEKGHLANAARYLNATDYKPGFLFTGYVIYNTDGSKMYEFSSQGIFDTKKMFYGNFLGCSSVIVERALFQRHRFDTDQRLILFEDWELWLRIISETPLHCIPASSVIMINHLGRSVLNYDYRQLVDKVLFFKNHAIDTIKSVRPNRRTFFMGIYSYAALHIALTGKNRGVALRYLFKAVSSNPAFVFKRRFFGTLKQLL